MFCARLWHAALRALRKLLPSSPHVTKAGSYGNEVPAFLCLPFFEKAAKAPFYGAFEKLAQVLLYLLYKKNNKQYDTHNKNNTNRLTHNKNNTAEAQLTDSFGEELYLGLAPQPGREQQKLPLGRA
ncbi:hypothetical protein V2J87_24910 [Pseudomonas alliivorans]|nr:hypothetical protein [Pseudomonas alliivorans]